MVFDSTQENPFSFRFYFKTNRKNLGFSVKWYSNLGQNICLLFHVLAQFLFTISETEQNYYHQKVNVRVAKRLKTYNLRELGNFKIIFKILEFNGEYPPDHLKAKFSRFSVKITKHSCKTFHRKTCFPQFHEFVYNPWSNIVWGNRFSFLIQSRPLNFIFSEYFSISKDPFAVQADIWGNALATT